QRQLARIDVLAQERERGRCRRHRAVASRGRAESTGCRDLRPDRPGAEWSLLAFGRRAPLGRCGNYLQTRGRAGRIAVTHQRGRSDERAARVAWSRMSNAAAVFARWRVRLGYILAIFVLWFAKP